MTVLNVNEVWVIASMVAVKTWRSSLQPKCGLVELGDGGVLRLHEVEESKKRSAKVEDKTQPSKKRTKYSQTCQCSGSYTKKPATCGFHRDCRMRLGTQCLINTHTKPSKGNKCTGNSKQDPIDADTQDTSIPQFNFNVSLDEVWQKGFLMTLLLQNRMGVQ